MATALPPGAASRCQSQALMKRGGQLTLSLGGTMRLVPASRSPLAVPASTGQPDAEGPMELAAARRGRVGVGAGDKHHDVGPGA